MTAGGTEVENAERIERKAHRNWAAKGQKTEFAEFKGFPGLIPLSLSRILDPSGTL